MADRVVMTLKWKGDEVSAKLLETAVPAAMNETTAAAAIAAKQSHPGWRNRTGTAEGSIRGEPAQKTGGARWVALFGSFDVAYFIWLEIGARGRAGDHTIRRAGDKEFPHLADRIRERARVLKATDR